MANKKINKAAAAPIQTQKANVEKPGSSKSGAIALPSSMAALTPYLPGITLFLVALIIGLFTYKDYGICWDEPFQRGPALLSYNYIFHGDPELFKTFSDNHGAGYELFLLIIEKLMNLTDSRDIYLMRHLVTHLCFLASAFAGYVLILRLFKNRFLASLGFIMFVFAPRLYAHSFFNSKDIPFMFMILVTFACCQRAFEKNKPLLFLFAGLACGYATSIRIMGVMVGLFIGIFLLIDFFSAWSKKDNPVRQALNILAFSVGFLFLLYLGWPYLWKAPVTNLVDSFSKLSHYDLWHGYVLINDHYIDGAKLPWYYIPLWFAVTTPELWLITGFAGAIWVIINFFGRPLAWLANTRERNFILYLACFFAPILSVILLHSVLYNDWRHLYFVYPSFVLLAIYFIDKILHTRYKIIMQCACALQLLLIALFMIPNHPFHQVYFNYLVSHRSGYLRSHYDMDYWGCSYKQGVDRILAADQSKVIRINCEYRTMIDNAVLFLPEEERGRLQFTDKAAADYYTSDSRGELYDNAPSTPFDSIDVLNSAIFYAFKEEKDPARQKQIRMSRIATFKEALAHSPNDTTLLQKIGEAYRDNEMLDTAEYYLKHVLELCPRNVDITTSLALLYNAEKRYPNAIELFKKALQLDPGLEGGHSNLGDAFFYNGDLDSAEYHERVAIQQNPQNPGAMNDLAGVYFFRKKYPQAIEMYKSAIKLNPQYVKPYANIGVCYIYLTKYDSAVYYSNAALAIDPGFSTANEIIAAAYQAAGKADLAKKYEAVAQKNNPAFKL